MQSAFSVKTIRDKVQVGLITLVHYKISAQPRLIHLSTILYLTKCVVPLPN